MYIYIYIYTELGLALATSAATFCCSVSGSAATFSNM